jgi:hypothetical protein
VEKIVGNFREIHAHFLISTLANGGEILLNMTNPYISMERWSTVVLPSAEPAGVRRLAVLGLSHIPA